MTDNTEPSVSRMRKNRPRPPTIIRGIISGEGFVSRWKNQTRFSKAEKKRRRRKKNRSARKFSNSSRISSKRLVIPRVCAITRSTWVLHSTLFVAFHRPRHGIKRRDREKKRRRRKKESGRRPVRCRRLFQTFEGVTAL